MRTVDVSIDPATAFEVFTGEIGTWYRGGSYSWNDPARAVGIRFEPGVGGRWIEIWDAATGEGFELGRITAWERVGAWWFRTGRSISHPSLAQRSRFGSSPIPNGTRVTLEHRGLNLLPPGVARAWQDRAWTQFKAWFREHVS